MILRAIIKALASPLLIISLGVAGALIGTGVAFVFTAATGAAILLFRTCPRLKIHGIESENINFAQGVKMMIPYGSPLYLSALIGNIQVQVQ